MLALQRGARALLEAARPRQWLKNALVLTGAGAVGGVSAVVRAPVLVVTGAFVAASVAVYLLNDVRDAEEDRRDPAKATRPVARGALHPRTALIGAALLAGGALSAAWYSRALLPVAIYLAANALYSAGLKRVPWLETVPVAAGFPLRVLAGGLAVAPDPTATAVALIVAPVAFGIVVAKREGELREGHRARAVAVHYRSPALCLARRWAFILAAVMNPGVLAVTSAGHGYWIAVSSIGLVLALGRFEATAARMGAPRPEETARRDLLLLGGAGLWAVGLVLA